MRAAPAAPLRPPRLSALQHGLPFLGAFALCITRGGRKRGLALFLDRAQDAGQVGWPGGRLGGRHAICKIAQDAGALGRCRYPARAGDRFERRADAIAADNAGVGVIGECLRDGSEPAGFLASSCQRSDAARRSAPTGLARALGHNRARCRG